MTALILSDIITTLPTNLNTCTRALFVFFDSNCEQKGQLRPPQLVALVQFKFVGSRQLGCPFLISNLNNMALGTRELSRYCAPADAETGCDQCDLGLREQCKQTYYLKQQTQVSSNEEVETQNSEPTTTNEFLELKQENDDLKELLREQDSNLEYLPSPTIYLVGGITLGLILALLVFLIIKVVTKK
jgi:hypothetical protein